MSLESRKESAKRYYDKNKEHYKKYRAQEHVKRRDEPAKRRHTLRRYGMIDSDYAELLSKQDGGCAICKTSDLGGRKYFDVDHDHITGKVRGLLCHVCNKYVGALENARRTAAEEYLRKYDPK